MDCEKRQGTQIIDTQPADSFEDCINICRKLFHFYEIRYLSNFNISLENLSGGQITSSRTFYTVSELNSMFPSSAIVVAFSCIERC